jgi:NitT/TauT family transport system substrate-binding protein
MKKLRSFTGLFLCFVLILATMAACAPAAGSSGPATLKLALLPILDALPIFVAQEQGYFQEQNLVVEFVPVGSAAERDQLMASGQADGMINDLISTILYNKDGIQIQIVSFARTATPDFPQYRLLASGDSGITSIEGLKGVEIGISEGSVIEYTTDRLLEAEGLAPEDIRKIAVPRIDLRMSMIDSGELQAANLPDPAASLAIQGGAVLILDDTSHPEYGNSVISFRKVVIDDNPQAIRGFLAALEKASTEINTDPTRWDTLLTEQKLVPEPLIGTYEIPPFPTGGLPTEEQWIDVLAWAKGKGLVEEEVDLVYGESITDEYLP